MSRPLKAYRKRIFLILCSRTVGRRSNHLFTPISKVYLKQFPKALMPPASLVNSNVVKMTFQNILYREVCKWYSGILNSLGIPDLMHDHPATYRRSKASLHNARLLEKIWGVKKLFKLKTIIHIRPCISFSCFFRKLCYIRRQRLAIVMHGLFYLFIHNGSDH